MSELLSCPFCGGEAEIGNPLGFPDGTFMNQAACSMCGAAIYGDGITANGATINTKKKWNTRAERTCRWVNVEGTLFVTECEANFDRVIPDNYCPNCGAKVVE